LRVSENRVLRRIFVHKRDEVTGDWIKLYEELHIIRMIKSKRMGWAGHVARNRKIINAYTILVGTPERKRSLGRPKHRWRIIFWI
jgi:hypothetical protein